QASAVRLAVLLLAATPLAAQEPRADLATAANTGVILDAYSFGSGFAFDNVVEWTVPVTVSQHLGQQLTVDLSAAFARASGATTSGNFRVSGFTDTDVRASWATGSGHLILAVAATLPTGQETVPDSTVPLQSALATELLAFTTPTLGSGGGATCGFATASSAATPNGSRSGIGDRILAYSSVSLPAGASSLVFYGYDMYRLRPRGLAAADSNAVQVPRGNVFALGARFERTLSPALSLAPNLEFASALTGESAGSLTLLGW